MKVYVVTSGSYSDFRIRWVVADEVLAKKLASKVFEGDYEEHEVRTDAPKHKKFWLGSQQLLIIDDGNFRIEVGEPHIESVVTWEGDYAAVPNDSKKTIPDIRPGTTYLNLWAEGYADRETVVRKLAERVDFVRNHFGV